MLWGGPGFGFHWWLGIFPILFIVVFAFFLFGGARRLFGRDELVDGFPSARELLDRRYAKGEIGQDEYLRMRKDLE